MRGLRVTRLVTQFGACSKAGGCAAWRTRHGGQDEGPLSSWDRGAFHGGLRTAGTAQTSWSKKKPRSNQENLFSGVLQSPHRNGELLTRADCVQLLLAREEEDGIVNLTETVSSAFSLPKRAQTVIWPAQHGAGGLY